MIEEYLIEHCSPTLASLKTASLFSYAYQSEEELSDSINRCNNMMKEKGIRVLVLSQKKASALVYVYRRSFLEKDLHKPDVEEFLKQYGYQDMSVGAVLHQLQLKLLRNERFPHEIGVFLGYPLEDVKGFINNSGKNCKCLGDWKVYGDEDVAKRQFAKFKRCKTIYQNMWNQGRSVVQLTVAV